MTPPRIAELLRRHDTDKGYFHRYGEVYDLLLDRHRSTASRVLELGILRGASLALWAEAFPAADIVGVDIAVPAVAWPANVTTVHANAYRAATVDHLATGGPFDIIIDDGPHTLASMLFVAEHYAPLLALGGTLILEDVLMAAWPRKIADRLPAGYSDRSFTIDRNTAPPLRADLDGIDPSRASRLFVVDFAS